MSKKSNEQDDGNSNGTPANRDPQTLEASPIEDEKPNIWMGCGLPAVISIALISLVFLAVA